LGEVVEFDLSGLSGESFVGVGHAIGSAGPLAIGSGIVDVDEGLSHVDDCGMELDGGIDWRGFECLGNGIGDAGFILADVLFARMREEARDFGNVGHGMIWLIWLGDEFEAFSAGTVNGDAVSDAGGLGESIMHQVCGDGLDQRGGDIETL